MSTSIVRNSRGKLGLIGFCVLFSLGSSGWFVPTVQAADTAQKEQTFTGSKSFFAYMQGYPDGLFRPEQGLIRSEIASILHRTLISPVASGNVSFADVPRTNWAFEDIALVVSNGWMEGTSSSAFSPNREVTRGEMAQILMNVYAWTPSASQSPDDATGHWAEQAIRAAVEQGVMIGYEDGTFRPDQPISRVETAKLFNRLMQRPADANLPMTWSDVPVSTPDYGDIMSASLDHPSLR